MPRKVKNVPSNAIGPGVNEGELLKAVSRSGYPLQTVIGARLLERDYRLLEEWPFVDEDTEETRTLDINAIRPLGEPLQTRGGRLSLWLSLLIECKQAELPYVAFEAVSPADYSEFPAIVGLIRGGDVGITIGTDPPTSRSVPVQTFLGLDSQALVQAPPVASSLSSVLRPKGKGSEKLELSGEHTFRSIMFPITKALAHYRSLYQHRNEGGWDNVEENVTARVVLPVVVVDAPLLLARVPTAEDAPEPTPWIRVLRRHTARTNRRWWTIPKPTMVDLVHKGFFDDYLSQFVDPFCDLFQQRISKHYETMNSGAFIPGLSPDDPLPKDPYKHVRPEPTQ